MGDIGKIESGKTSSDAFAGCAPVEWVKEKAEDFAEWAAKGVWNLADGVKDEFRYFFTGFGETLGEWGGFLNNLPGVKPVKQFTGVVVAKGREVVGQIGECGKAVIKGLTVVGGLAVAAGGLYLLSQGGFLAGIATAITMGVLARFLVRRVGIAYRFNWNITQKQINDRAKARINSIATQAGSLVGSALAYVACARAGGLLVTKFNPLSAALVKEVNEDVWQDVKANFKSLVRVTATSLEEWITLTIFSNVRSLIKKVGIATLKDEGWQGRLKKTLTYWGSEDSKPWSFAKAVQDKIESIPFEAVRNFVEELREEFADVCSQSAYALSYGL